MNLASPHKWIKILGQTVCQECGKAISEADLSKCNPEDKYDVIRKIGEAMRSNRTIMAAGVTVAREPRVQSEIRTIPQRPLLESQYAWYLPEEERVKDMATYYRWENVTKKEYIVGIEVGERGCYKWGNATVGELARLLPWTMATRWFGDHVRLADDHSDTWLDDSWDDVTRDAVRSFNDSLAPEVPQIKYRGSVDP